MIDLKFPDGASRQYPDDATGRDVAASISPSLAKKAALVALNGEQRDLDRPLGGSRRLQDLIMRDDPEALETIRHDAAHVLAQAVQELFPGTQVTIGPAIEDGFYYDFARDEPFSTDDFADDRERRWREIVDRDETDPREVWDRDEAIATSRASAKATRPSSSTTCPGRRRSRSTPRATGSTSAAGRTCRRRKFVGKAFKLTKLAGAYWRGDHHNRSCSASTARPGPRRRISTPI